MPTEEALRISGLQSNISGVINEFRNTCTLSRRHPCERNRLKVRWANLSVLARRQAAKICCP